MLPSSCSSMEPVPVFLFSFPSDADWLDDVLAELPLKEVEQCDFGSNLLWPNATAAALPTTAPPADGHLVARRVRAADEADATRGLTTEMVKAVLHLPQLQAAAACGFGLTWFKRACRALGIARWPHRKFQSIERAMDACADPVWLNASRETRAQVSRWVHVLEAAEHKLRDTLGSASMKPADKIVHWTTKQRHASRASPRRLIKAAPSVAREMTHPSKKASSGVPQPATLVWVTEPDEHLCCSICLEPFSQPVQLPCGHTFCRDCASQWYATGTAFCPLGRCTRGGRVRPATLPINFTVQEAVAQLRVHCRFGLCEGGVGRWTADPARCRAELHTADIASHEAVCVYGPRKLRPRTKR